MARSAHAVGLLVGMCLALVAGPARAEPTEKEGRRRSEGEILIWSGGKTRAEAERQREILATYLDVLDDILLVSPVVLESARVEGLKPGFFVVALGVCSEEEVKAPLSVFQAIDPEIYTRTVKYKPTDETPALTCPEMESVTTDDAGAPVRWKLAGAERLTQKGSTLVGLVFAYRWDEAGDFARAYHAVASYYLLVEARTRRLKQSKIHESPGDAASLESFKSEKGHLVSTLKYGAPPCEPGTDAFKAWRTQVSASVVKATIHLSVAEPQLIDMGTCGFTEEARMVSGEDRLEEALEPEQEVPEDAEAP